MGALTDMTVRIRNGFLEADFDPGTGDWQALRTADGLSLLGRCGRAVVPQIEGKPLPWSPFPKPPRPELTRAQTSADGTTCEMSFECEGLRVIHRAALDPAAPVLRQSVRIECFAGEGPRLLTGVHYRLPGFVLDAPADCLLQTPCQAFAPDTPYETVAATPLDRRVVEPLPGFPGGWLRSSPDEGPGLVAVENRRVGRVVSAWLHSEMANTFPTLDGRQGLLDVEFQHKLHAWLKPGDQIVSEGFVLLLTTGTLKDHLRHFRNLAYGQWGPVAGATAPDWVRDVRLFQIAPYPLAPWFARLDDLRQLGFNLLYLTPVWEGRWYVVDDHYRISPSVGSHEELKRFAREAHRRGFRVIFDLIPQGVGAANRLAREHPEWLVRDALGRPFGSHGWGPCPGAPYNGHTYSMDWGNPDYRRFIAEWAAWNVREFDIDGFRTDALHWKEPNLALDNPHTTLGGIRLAEEVRAAVRAVKRNVFLLSELAGPSFLRSHEAIYEDNWLIAAVTEGWLKGQPLFTGRQWARYLALARASRPEGGLRATCSANHDLVGLVPLIRFSPAADAVSFVHYLSDAIPFVMWEEIGGREALFRQLSEWREEMRGWECDHSAAYYNTDSLFVAAWLNENGTVRVAAANLGATPVDENVRIVLPDGERAVPVRLAPYAFALLALGN